MYEFSRQVLPLLWDLFCEQLQQHCVNDFEFGVVVCFGSCSIDSAFLCVHELFELMCVTSSICLF